MTACKAESQGAKTVNCASEKGCPERSDPAATEDKAAEGSQRDGNNKGVSQMQSPETSEMRLVEINGKG